MGEKNEHQSTASDFNREDQPATPAPLVCEWCEEPLNTGRRFCSRACYDEWQRENGAPPRAMTLEEMKAEMKGVFERLGKEGTS